jgi:hypothetical protein
VEVPARQKVREWKQLRERFYSTQRTWAAYRQRAIAHRIHELERDIARHSAMPDTEGRRSWIRDLESQLAALRGA